MNLDRRRGWFPVYSLARRAVRANYRLHKQNRVLEHDLAVARAQVEEHKARLADSEERNRRLSSTIDFLVDCRIKTMEREA